MRSLHMQVGQGLTIQANQQATPLHPSPDPAAVKLSAWKLLSAILFSYFLAFVLFHKVPHAGAAAVGMPRHGAMPHTRHATNTSTHAHTHTQ